MKKNNLKILVLIIIIVSLIISFFIFKNYLKQENDNYDLYNDYSRATIVYSFTYEKYKEDYFHTIRYQQRYFKGDKLTKMELINDLKEYDFIDVLNYIPDNEKIEKMEENLDNFVEYLMYINYYLNPNGAESGFTKNENNKYYYQDGNNYIYNYTKKIISLDTLEKLFEEYLENEGYSLDNYFYLNLWNNNIINKYYKGNNYNYKKMKNDVTNDYDTFYQKFKPQIDTIISNIFSSYIEFLMNGLSINEQTNDITSINYKTSISYNTISIDYKIIEIQPLLNDLTKYSNKQYALDITELKKQLADAGYPLLLS